MLSPEPASPKLSVNDIWVFSDDELVQYIKRNRLPNGDFNLTCYDGRGNLSKDQRAQLAERLKLAAEKASEEERSRPVDSDQLAARLLQISANNDASAQRQSRPPPRRDTISPPDPMIAVTAHYHDLVKDGGRPLYPISLADKISKNPKEYRELLLPWQTYPDKVTPEWDLFQLQLARWEQFRLWQYDNRNIDGYDGFPAFIESKNRGYAREATTWQQSYPLRTEEMYMKELAEQWSKRPLYLEVYGDYGFPEYFDAVKQRLAQHGFTQPFSLHEDPSQQDKLTTWIEYLNYEYWWYDKYTRSLNRFEAHYDKHWKKLVDSGVLSPSENDEHLRAYRSISQRETEQQKQEEAVESAKSAAEAAKTAAQNETPPIRRQIIEEASSRLNKAEESLNATVRRNNLIDEFLEKTWRIEIRIQQKSQGNLVQWVLDQVPLIDAELKESQAVEGSLNAGHDSGPNRRRDGDQRDKVISFRASTERGQNSHIFPLDDEAQSATPEERRPKRSHPDDPVTDKEEPSKRRRVSAQDSDAASNRTGQVPIISTSKRNGNDEIPSSGGDAPSTRPSRRVAQPRSPSRLVKSQSRAAESGSHNRQGTKNAIWENQDITTNDQSLKRKWGALADSSPRDEVENEPARRRHKADHHLGHSPGDTDRPTVGKQKNTDDAPGSLVASRPLRRSARIAARRELQQNSVAQSGAAKGPPRGSRTRTAKPMASSLSKEPQNPQSKASAAKTRKQNARTTSQRGASITKETLKGRRRGRQSSAAG